MSNGDGTALPDPKLIVAKILGAWKLTSSEWGLTLESGLQPP